MSKSSKRKEQKELAALIAAENERLEKEVDEELKKEKEENKQKEDIWDIIIDTDHYDDQLRQYYTEEELQEEEEFKKETKRLYFSVAGIFGGLILVIVVGMSLLTQAVKTDLEKITMPKMQEYLNTKYGEGSYKVNKVELICYDNEDKKKECSDIQYALLGNDKYVYAINNETLGDNIGKSSLLSTYQSMFKKYASATNIFNQESDLIFTDYFHDYYYNAPSHDVLPNDIPFNVLLLEKKLIVHDFVTYQGNIDFNNLKNMLSQFDSRSVIFLLKLVDGLPYELSKVTSKEYINFKITGNVSLDSGNIYYDLDKNLNAITGVSITKVADNGVTLLDEKKYGISSPIFFNINCEKRHYGHDEDTRSTITLLQSKNKRIGRDSAIIFEGSSYGDANFKEIKYTDSKYPFVLYLVSGNNTFIVIDSESNGVGMAYKTELNNSFLCQKLGIC